MKFTHTKSNDTDYRTNGLRAFFAYKDLGIKAATDGKLLVQLVKANEMPESGTGWHYHEADFHVVYMIKGWARFMYEDKETLVEAGDCVYQIPGIRHYLFDYSQDMEFLEIVSPANFTDVKCESVATVPPPTPWK